MPTLNGACPGCGQNITLEVSVRTAGKPMLIGDGHAETGQGGSPDRPRCPTCDVICKLVEATAKKGDNAGRRFTGWKCPNKGCDGYDKFTEFHWLTEAAAA